MRACWDTMVLSPPLVISKKEIDELVRMARVALDKTYADVRAEMSQN
jgi:putrescine aminotransferase